MASGDQPERGEESRLLLVATVSFALGAEPSKAGRAGYLYFIFNKQDGKSVAEYASCPLAGRARRDRSGAKGTGPWDRPTEEADVVGAEEEPRNEDPGELKHACSRERNPPVLHFCYSFEMNK